MNVPLGKSRNDFCFLVAEFMVKIYQVLGFDSVNVQYLL